MAAAKKVMMWAGWVITVLIALLLTMSATMKFINSPEVAEQVGGKFGYPPDLMLPLGIVELCCMIIYLIPRTAVLGAVLLTGYLGGAVATHVRVHDPFIMPVMIGVFVWLALYLRDTRIRAVLPLRCT